MSVTPYGKDKMPDRVGMFLMRVAGVQFGKLDCSNRTGFEAPDPIFWSAAGYAVVQADVRGMHKSEGHAGVLTDVDARDYYDVIEWAARQPWSNGAVGLLGVSYLAMSQWRVAALRPPSLKGICPWERGLGPIARIRVSGRNPRNRVHRGLVEVSDEAGPQPRLRTGRGFPDRSRRSSPG
jgi:putative CocE/NonD family hydrolase